MALDPSILFHGQSANPGAGYYGAQQAGIEGQQINNQKGMMQIQAAQDEEAKQQAIQNIARQHVGPDGQLDQKGFVQHLAQIDPITAQGFAQQFSAQEQARQKQVMDIQTHLATLDKTKLETVAKQTEATQKAVMALEGTDPLQRSYLWSQHAAPMLNSVGMKVDPSKPPSDNEIEYYKNQSIAAQKALQGLKPEAWTHVDSQNGIYGMNTQTGEVKPLVSEGAILKPKPAASMGSGVALSPEALQMMADRTRSTGEIPNLGMGKAGSELRVKVLNKAAETPVDLASAKADFGSNQASLKDAQKRRDQLITFEKTALANTDVFLSKAQKVIDTGSPWLNRPLRDLASGAFGSEAQAAANTALQTIIPEFAKINSGSLAGVLSDHARQEAAKLLPENATLGQYVAAVNVLKQDAKNRHKYMDETIGEIKSRIGKGTQGETTTAPATKVNPANGKTYYLHSDGKYYSEKG